MFRRSCNGIDLILTHPGVYIGEYKVQGALNDRIVHFFGELDKLRQGIAG
jgi:hypothetical protein